MRKSFSVPRQIPARGHSITFKREDFNSLHSLTPGGLSSTALIQRHTSGSPSFLMRGCSGLDSPALEHSIERSGPSILGRSLEGKTSLPSHSPFLSGRHDSFAASAKQIRRVDAGMPFNLREAYSDF